MALVALATTMALAPAAAVAATPSTGQPASHMVVLHRGAHAHSVNVVTRAAGEVLLDLTAAAPGADNNMCDVGKIESPSSPATPAVGDQRTYLYIEVDKDTADPRQVGLTVGVRLRGDPTLYRSDHGEPSWSVERDVPAATTVELPADIAEIIAIRQPMSNPDTGASETVTAVNRAFFVDPDYLPRQSFFSWHGDVTLTPSQSQATPAVRVAPASVPHLPVSLNSPLVIMAASRLATLPAEVPVSPAEPLRENRLMTTTRHER